MEWQLFADLAERAGDRTVSAEVAPEASVQEALEALLDAHPALADRVLEDGRVADHVTVLADGTALRSDELDRPVADVEELALCPPVSGG